MPPSYRRQAYMLTALALASFTTAAVAGDLAVAPIHDIEPGSQQVVILAGVDDKCIYFGALSGEEHEPSGFLARLGDHVRKAFGDMPLKDWTLTIQRKQCDKDLFEVVNGTVRLGELIDPVPSGTLLKVTLQPG